MAGPIPIAVDSPITLGQFVKLAGFAETGGDAKGLVTSGLVRVNGEIDRRRGHSLAPGDIVEVGGYEAEVVPTPASTRPPIVGGQN